MRGLSVRLLAAAAVLGGTTLSWTAVSAAQASAPPPTFTCTGTLASPHPIPGGTYSALNMPAGSVCEIKGPGKVADHAGLNMGADSGLITLGGGLSVQGPTTLGTGAAFGADFMNTENAPVNLFGPVTVGNDAAFILGTEIPYGPLFATIQGPVLGQDASAVVIQNTYIAGAASVYGGGALNHIVETLSHGGPGNYIDFEDDHVSGNVSDVGYGGVWGGVIRSIIHGNLAFAFNSQKKIDEYDIGSDIIYGDAYCDGNNPPPNMGSSSGSPSLVTGTTFGSQAKTCTGVPGGGTGHLPG